MTCGMRSKARRASVPDDTFRLQKTMHNNFADWYNAISLRPDAGTLEARWRTVEVLAGRLKIAQVPSLVRVFFLLPGADQFMDEIRAAARDEDKTFLTERDRNELAVLAGGIIAHEVTKSSSLAGAVALAVSSVDAQSLRQTPRLQGVVDEAMRYLADESVRVRKIDENPVADLNATALNKQVTAKGGVTLSDVNSVWSAVEVIFKGLLHQHAQHTESINRAVGQMLRRQREESDILWWLFSEHTLDGTKAFHDLKLPEACFWGGKDLAELTRFLPGPFAAPAFLHRMLRLVRNEVPANLEISEAVDACGSEWKQKWVATLTANEAPDLFPMLFAITKSAEVGGGTEWTAAFEHATGLTAHARLAPAHLAFQVYNEVLLQRSLSMEG